MAQTRRGRVPVALAGAGIGAAALVGVVALSVGPSEIVDDLTPAGSDVRDADGQRDGDRPPGHRGDHGRPPWAGGPGDRGEDPPGWAQRDRQGPPPWADRREERDQRKAERDERKAERKAERRAERDDRKAERDS